MKKNKNCKAFIMFLAITVLMIAMITGCSKNVQTPGGTNNIGISEDESKADNTEKKGDENPSQTDVNEEQNDSDSNSVMTNDGFFGKVKRIIGNEVEIEIGLVPDQAWDEKIDPEEKKEHGVPQVMVKERENPPGMEDIVAPNPLEYGGSIFGKDGEVNLAYTGESKTIIIPAGTDIRNSLGRKATLDSIEKGSVLAIKPKVIDGKDAGIDKILIYK
ncbi:hypothetical protein [Paenibacillus donghaensis]|uniref:Lipoprotein n=1 Tax=Paenibacillus donghaensis TaxID=414771 RepID=A0A2Z2KF38_9BACL|nr:hypothetical protein [Paenibacillus donghaensis]ASA20699.1 hypothetical protein B9T62_07790 [Paenibacillus donghaensis]